MLVIVHAMDKSVEMYSDDETEVYVIVDILRVGLIGGSDTVRVDVKPLNEMPEHFIEVLEKGHQVHVEGEEA
jgi:hypothetical protein